MADNDPKETKQLTGEKTDDGLVERAKDTVDAITRISEQNPDTPLVKPIDQEIADCLCHGAGSEKKDVIIPQGLCPSQSRSGTKVLWSRSLCLNYAEGL